MEKGLESAHVHDFHRYTFGPYSRSYYFFICGKLPNSQLYLT